MKTKELIEWIEKWNPYNEHITISTIFAKMRFKSGSIHVINKGGPGTGKSFSTLALINALDLGTEIILDNTTTDRGLFEIFLNYPEQDILIDECSTLLKSKKTQDMLKLAIESKPLTWTKADSIETTQPYQGNLIINTNNYIDPTVIDRCLYNKAGMNREKAMAFNEYYVSEQKSPTDFTPFLTHIKGVVKIKTEPTLTDDEINKGLEMVQTELEGSDRDEGYSRRSIVRTLQYLKHSKRLFGKLDEEVFEYIKPYAVAYIDNTHSPGLIESIVGNGAIEKPTLVKRVAGEGKYSENHARRLVNAAIKEKKIKVKGKLVTTTNKNTKTNIDKKTKKAKGGKR